MENHPIPQDVTGFKFKLIGSVTIKQFLYLLGGGIMAVLLIFVFPGPLLVRLPLGILFAGVGLSLAFVPIDGRPMDKMIMNFLKALPSENQYLFHKQGVNLAVYEMFKPPTPTVVQAKAAPQVDRRREILFTQFGGTSMQPDPNERAMLENVNALFAQGGQVATPQPTAPQQPVSAPPSQTAQKIKVVLPPQDSKKTAQATDSTPPTKQQVPQQVVIEKPPAQAAQKEPVVVVLPEMPQATAQALKKADQNIENIQKQADKRVEEAHNEREMLEKRIKELEAQKEKKKALKPSTDAGTPQTTEKVKVISQQPNQFKAGFPSLPDIPNVILGIIRDARGKVLPNILVEVVDTNNIPVRAFKTNQLGQFASATPLPAGTYKIYFEDSLKNHEFETVQVTLDDKIFQPLEIISIDQREKLRRDLFGK